LKINETWSLKEVGGCSSLPGETGERERELQLSAGNSLRTGKGLHQYKFIVKEVLFERR